MTALLQQVVAGLASGSIYALLALGIVANFSFYVFINTAMVTGLIPVVGVPLPLISYGGTAMLAVIFGFGLLLNVGVNREVRLGPKGETEPG